MNMPIAGAGRGPQTGIAQAATKSNTISPPTQERSTDVLLKVLSNQNDQFDTLIIQLRDEIVRLTGANVIEAAQETQETQVDRPSCTINHLQDQTTRLDRSLANLTLLYDQLFKL